MPIGIRIVRYDIALAEVLQSVFKLQLLPQQLCFDPFGFFETTLSAISLDPRLPCAKGTILTEESNLLTLGLSIGCHSFLERF